MLTFVVSILVFVSLISTNAVPRSLLEMRAGTTTGSPIPIGMDIKHSLSRNVIKAAVPFALTMCTNRNSASAADALISVPSQQGKPPLPTKDLPLGTLAYTELGTGEDTMPMCRILNGMWQVSGSHGYEPEINAVIAEMSHCADEGFTTFDLADIYGPAEEYVGKFCKGRLASSMSKNCQFFTKWVPSPEEITRKQAIDASDRSLRRMSSDRLDLVQFNWFDYKNKYYYDAMDHLMFLKQDGKIRNIGLTNFDTEHLADLIDEGAPIVSNQIAYSIIDTRPQKMMAKYCVENNVKMLCYGTLMGGFVSSNWLNKPMPARETLTNVSLRKYLPWIVYWGKWILVYIIVLSSLPHMYPCTLPQQVAGTCFKKC